ncbi:hypothetical protein TWF718_003758 [Orbilia javanica]|uniref:Uncharacterized protein n=1 Tax=Orbilia javanica TaxID=47235 RepID=A0AAN8MRG0_9PEZI
MPTVTEEGPTSCVEHIKAPTEQPLIQPWKQYLGVQSIEHDIFHGEDETDVRYQAERDQHGGLGG